jgi:hypothetical protein
VIVADRLYSYDHGKLIAAPGKDVELRHDIRTYNLHAPWKMAAADIKREVDLASLEAKRPPSKDAQRRWLLHALHAHEADGAPAPKALPEQESACPGWAARIAEAVAEGLLALRAGVLSLTAEGRELVLNGRRAGARRRDPPERHRGPRPRHHANVRR